MNNIGVIIFISLLIFVGLILGMIKLIRRKEITDKIVVLDTMTTAINSAVILFALYSKNSYILDISLIYSILSFASVIIIARYIENSI